ncbi:hypothetical protein [Streptomyces flaveus]|uniref:hypothetical protein n=1 Tax=Streptomyces flaveus TaxID=66370 RepID=UPI001FE316BC|nr:hypothetical protein [Streptomyces flaveus]
MVCRQVVSLGRPYAGRTVAVQVAESTLTAEMADLTWPLLVVCHQPGGDRV